MPKKSMNNVAAEENGQTAAQINFNNKDDLVPVDESIIDELSIGESVEADPTMTDEKWQDRVMAAFEESELENDRPKVGGLRRVVRKLIGPILKGRAEVKQCPTIDNDQRATVEYTITVLNRYNLEDDEEPYVVEFTDAADAWHGNINGDEFKKFPVANAATRAEVRALRKALSLDVVASEELSDQPISESGFDGMISESQITKLDIKCQEFKIDPLKFINMGKTKFKRIEDVPRRTAVRMFQLISDYQRKIRVVPETIKGYRPNWRQS